MNEKEYFRIADWHSTQQYHDRNPPWIKLHYDILTSEAWIMLDDKGKVLMLVCMLLASRNNGRVLNEPRFIQKAAYLDSLPNLQPLVDIGFLIPDDGIEDEEEAWASRYISKALRAAVMEKANNACEVCGSTEHLEIDHKVPVSKGGDGSESNLQVLCRSCNRRKRMRTALEFKEQSLRTSRTSVAAATQQSVCVASATPEPDLRSLETEKRREETDTEESRITSPPPPQPPTVDLFPEPQQAVVVKPERKAPKPPKPEPENPGLSREDQRWFVEQWQTQYPGADPAWEHEKLTWIRMYARLKTHSLEEIKRRWLLYLRKTDKYFDGHVMKIFLDRDFDKALESANGNGSGPSNRYGKTHTGTPLTEQEKAEIKTWGW